MSHTRRRHPCDSWPRASSPEDVALFVLAAIYATRPMTVQSRRRSARATRECRAPSAATDTVSTARIPVPGKRRVLKRLQRRSQTTSAVSMHCTKRPRRPRGAAPRPRKFRVLPNREAEARGPERRPRGERPAARRAHRPVIRTRYTGSPERRRSRCRSVNRRPSPAARACGATRPDPGCPPTRGRAACTRSWIPNSRWESTSGGRSMIGRG
jgi:hypothetical protein